MRIGAWSPLGGQLNPAPASFVQGPSLAARSDNPVLAFSVEDSTTFEENTFVSVWTGSAWEALGTPIAESGPAVAIDGHRNIYVCTGNNGPFVRRWNGTSFVPVGTHIGVETGYKGFRWTVSSCSGLVFDGDTPIVTWSAHVGAKADRVYAARWNPGRQLWEKVGAIGQRAMQPTIAIDRQRRLYMSAYTPGGSYGGGATTRVYRFDGQDWIQLGDDMTHTANPVIAATGRTVTLAFQDEQSGLVVVKRWSQGAWVELPSPGEGDFPALDTTLSGHPVIAYVDAATPPVLHVKVFSGDWKEAGSGVANLTWANGPVALSLDAHAHPITAWADGSFDGEVNISASRFTAALH